MELTKYESKALLKDEVVYTLRWLKDTVMWGVFSGLLTAGLVTEYGATPAILGLLMGLLVTANMFLQYVVEQYRASRELEGYAIRRALITLVEDLEKTQEVPRGKAIRNLLESHNTQTLDSVRKDRPEFVRGLER